MNKHMQLEIEQLSYTLDALEPYISRETMYEHYEKHYKNYINKVLNTNYSSLQEAIECGDNNAKQVLLHNLYWRSLKAQGDYIDEEKKQALIDKGMSHFGSGWLFITKNKENHLELFTISNAEIIKTQNTILSVIDLWEHSYYIDYKSNKLKYLQNSMNIINLNLELNDIEKKLLYI